MSTLKKRVERLERTADDGDGGGWEILMVELTDDGPDEETAIALAVAKAEAGGRPVNMGIIPPNGIRYIIVDMRTDKTSGGEK